MQFGHSFSVQAPLDAGFATLSDVERGVPRAARIGPVFRRCTGRITVLERDADARRVVMTNRARDAQGRDVGEARIEIGLSELGSPTDASSHSRVPMADGMLAEKTITEASAKQMTEFTANLRALVGG